MNKRINDIIRVIDNMERISLITNLTTLHTSRKSKKHRIPPTKVELLTLTCKTSHRHNAVTITAKPIFMMILEEREFCFNMFFSFFITMTFFFMRHLSGRSFCFIEL